MTEPSPQDIERAKEITSALADLRVPHGHLCVSVIACALAAERERITKEIDLRIATWMGQQGWATGHGDTIEDLLGEIAAHARATGALADEQSPDGG